MIGESKILLRLLHIMRDLCELRQSGEANHIKIRVEQDDVIQFDSACQLLDIVSNIYPILATTPWNEPCDE